MSIATIRLFFNESGTSPLITRRARPSTIAVLPTPGSPMSTGLFFVRRESTCITRRISLSRPITGSILPRRANSVRSRPYYAIALAQKSGKKMFVGDFGIVQLRRKVLRRLQRLLHFLRISVDAHPSKYQTGFARQLRFGKRAPANFL